MQKSIILYPSVIYYVRVFCYYYPANARLLSIKISDHVL